MRKKLIDIENLTIKAEEKTLVNSVTFHVCEGEMLGIVGESGSGKTLTVKGVVNLLPEGLDIKADKVEVFGKDFYHMPYRERRELVGRKLGLVPQNTVFYLHPMIKIKNQMADGYLHYNKVTKEEALARCEDIMSQVGLRDTKRVLNSYPWQLSGGMRQRVNIAMAMLNNPGLLIADEPTTALDSTIQKQVMDLFQNINKKMNTTMIIISHDLGLVKYYCDRIIVMYAGRIVEMGNKNELFENPCHPYTKALISVIPSLNIKKEERLSEIPGYVPEDGRDMEGCIFRDRCEFASEECQNPEKKNFVSETHYHTCCKF